MLFKLEGFLQQRRQGPKGLPLKKSRDWTAFQEAYVLKFAGIKSVEEIAREVNRTPQAVRGWARRNGVVVINRAVDQRIKHPRAHVDKCIELFTAGMPIDEIAGKMGIPFHSVKSWVYGERRHRTKD